MRSAGRTSRRRRTATRVERYSTIGWSSGTTATSSSAPTALAARPGRAVRPDQQRQLGQQLRHVEAELEVGGGHVTVTGIKQDDVAIAGEHDAVRGQGPVRDAVRMQLQHGLPYPQQLVIGRRGISGPGRVGGTGEAGSGRAWLE